MKEKIVSCMEVGCYLYGRKLFWITSKTFVIVSFAILLCNRSNHFAARYILVLDKIASVVEHSDTNNDCF